MRSPVPFRLNRILVTTDFSNKSKEALPFAAAFARQFGGGVTLLNVLEPSSHFVGLESMALLQTGDATMGRLYAGLDAMAGQSFGKGIQVETQVRTGKPYRQIIKAARDSKTDLLVMATHGYTGLKHALLGSTTERVVRQAPCPVLTVHGSDLESKAGSVLVATDFSDNAAQSFPWALAVAKAFGARLTLMHVVEKFPIDAMLGRELTRDNVKQLMSETQDRLETLAASLADEKGHPPELVVRYGKPFDEITRVARELGASLIVIATHGHTGLNRVYLGSVAERVVRHAHCPVLVVRDDRLE